MMRVGKHFWRNLILVGALVGATRSATAGPLETSLAKMDRAAAQFTGLSADLSKTSYTAVVKDSSTESGTIVMKRLKGHNMRMLFDVKQPEPKSYFIDGHKFQQYLPKAQTVQEYDIGKYKSMVNEFLLLGFGATSAELRNSYEVSLGGPDTVAGQKATRLELIPKSKDLLMYVAKVELWISDATGLPVQQKFYPPGSGDYTVATYTNAKINPNLPDSAGKLNLPKGVTKEYPQK